MIPKSYKKFLIYPTNKGLFSCPFFGLKNYSLKEIKKYIDTRLKYKLFRMSIGY